MGRSRGGLTSKIHALVDAEGRPVALKITEGQAHDGRSAANMLGGLGAGQILLGDRAYDSDALRARMAEQGAWANVRPMPNRKKVLAFSPSDLDALKPTSNPLSVRPVLHQLDGASQQTVAQLFDGELSVDRAS